MKAIKLLLMCLMVCLSSSSLFAIDDGVFFTVNGLTYEKASSVAAQTANDVKVYMGNYSGAITIPATVTYNGQTCNVVEIGSYCFENCNLSSISIGSKVRYINDCAFSGCSISNGITIPSNVTTIAYNAFRNTKLTSLTIPSTAKFDMSSYVEFSGSSLVTLNLEVTTLTQLSQLDCSSLKNLSLSSGKLPSNTFKCPKLETLTLKHSSKLAMNASAWPSSSYVPAPKNIILYVPQSLVSTYKADSFWSTFGVVTYIGDTSAHLHSYGQPTWTWASDGKSASAKFSCSSCSNSETIAATITSAVKTAATCTVKGITTYTAKVTFNGTTYTSTKDVQDIPVTGHKYGQPTWTWASDGKSASAKFTCTSCSNIMTKTATITSAVKTAATCSSMGTTTYTAKVTYNSTTYTSTKDVQDIPTTAHIYNMSGKCTVCGNQLTFDENGFSDLGNYYQEPTLGSNGFYQIANAGNLYWYAKYVNTNNTAPNAEITKDITVNSNVLKSDGTPNSSSFKNWTPIGINQGSTYKAYFYGNNHTISGLYVNSNAYSYVGLFGYGIECLIKDLIIKDSYFCSTKAGARTGGIIGYNVDCNIINCHNYATIVSNSSAGGIVGYGDGSEEGKAYFTKCSNFGSVTSRNNDAGGICGDGIEVDISYCFNAGKIDASEDDGAIAGYLLSSSCSYCVAATGTSSYLGTGSSKSCYFVSDFSTGEAAYILNGKINGGINWYQNIDNGQTPDLYPVTDTNRGKVYYDGNGYSNTPYEAREAVVSAGKELVDISFSNTGAYEWEYVGSGHTIQSTNWHVDSSTSTTTITIKPKSNVLMSFDYTVSSEEECDYLYIYLNGQKIIEAEDYVQNSYTCYLKSGQTYALSLKYEKDVSLYDRDDRATVKNMSFTAHSTHSYGQPTWTWATDGKSATAKFTCSVCNDTQTKSATITSAVKTQPTCTTMGTTTYTAKVTFNNTQYTSTKNVQDIAAKGHDLIFVNASEPTADCNGNIAYWECSQCHLLFADEDGTIETSTDDIAINRVVNYLFNDLAEYNDSKGFYAEELHYVRNFKNTNWQALYVPFSMNYEDWKDNFYVSKINAYYQYDDDNDGVVDHSALELLSINGGSLEPNYPYLIKAKSPEEKTFVLKNVRVYPSDSRSIECSTAETSYSFVGTYSKVYANTISGDIYAVSGGQITAVPKTSYVSAQRFYIKKENREPQIVELPFEDNSLDVRSEYVLSDQTPFEETEAFMAEDLKYIRSFKNTNWQALYIPVSMHYEDWKDNFYVARLNAYYQYDEDNDGVIDRAELEFFTVTDGYLIPNHPYLIKAREAGDYTIELSNTIVYPASSNSIDCSTVTTHYMFTGTPVKVNANTFAYDIYAVSGGAITKVPTNSYVSPQRFYLYKEEKDSQSNAMPKMISIRVEGMDDETYIRTVRNSHSNIIYNLQGMQIGSDEENETLNPGIYIKNGKTFIVK